VVHVVVAGPPAQSQPASVTRQSKKVEESASATGRR